MYYRSIMCALRMRTFVSIYLLLAGFCVTSSALFANKKPPPTPINLNTATSEELQLVPGIGPVTAEKILQMRKSYGAFKSVDDLRAVRGIGPKRLEKMRKYLTVGKAASQSKPASASKPATPSKPAVPPKPASTPAEPPDRSL